ncbi:uncharacterized protein LOC110451404 [Mizuhopecten yessoensis]|uniref:DUF229 domain containing protein n=1 Tax=Mizuhopecten yessoensis TaxID=6573 RepID=A0A210QLR7_MIZYE|nr:uncharacterized protein LOC110451404 [Mizuhopecten yessoensis]XP_021355074.1 uncharacterized protein LOC110451404 [Mizuhopecten yessoensis]XP_021355075.1 uncharacterized protein LOC110451404 [Mizuhopecten yessoensis]OWF49683.1 hypothetical protein KP79_PYT20696 [Mizuhopecten yessoensis]
MKTWHVSPFLRSRFGKTILLSLCVLVFVVFTNLFYGFSVLTKTSPMTLTSSVNYFRMLQHMPKKLIRKSGSTTEQICRHPRLSLFQDSIQSAFHPMDPLVCLAKNLFYFEKGVLRMNDTVLNPFDQYNRHEFGEAKTNLSEDETKIIRKCLYRGIERVTDDYHTFTETIVKEKPPFSLLVEHDFMSVKCFYHHPEDDEKEPEEKEPDSDEKNKLDEKDQSGVADEEKNFGPINFDEMNRESFRDVDETLNEHGRDALFGSEYDHSFDGNFSYDYLHSWHDYHTDFEEQDIADFDQFLVQVHPKPSVFQRIKDSVKNKHATHLNVLMLGLDSMSHLSYQRKLPNTYRYLRDELDMVILDAYNIVGDATTAALIPILTGKTEVELPEVRINHDDAVTVDKYPMIWNEFRDQGYATLFAEDEPSISAFNLRLKGFENQPTDHYMRPFWQAIWGSQLRENSVRYCTGGTPHHSYTLDYVKDFFVKYNNVSKFTFAFMSELTHWDNNPGEHIDNDLFKFLKFFEKSGYLDNTLLILMADHGARYSRVRHTIQGKLEERLPMFALRFPPKYQSFHPRLMENLRRNSKKLTTPFDIHETLKDVLDLSRTSKSSPPHSRGISLLQQIPLNRTCAMAKIDVHWCTCLMQENRDVKSEHVQKAAFEILSYINQLTEPVRSECVPLNVKEIILAYLMIPNEKVLTYIRSRDADNRVANFSQEATVDIVHYQITMVTLPNNGMYEATILMNVTNGRIKVNPEMISRLDLYGTQPACIQRRYPDLRKYCFCEQLLHHNTTWHTVVLP